MRKSFTFYFACMACILMWQMNLSAQTTRYVPCGSGTPCYTTIQDAVDASDPGDIILVAAGTYNENVTIDKPLILLGANANVPCGSRGPESIVQDLTPSDLPIFTVLSDNVTINGFEIIDPWTNDGIYNGASGHSFLNIIFNKIHDIGTLRGSGNIYAVHYMVGEGITTTDINVSDNCISNVANTTTAEGSTGGIWFGHSLSTGIINNIVVERNTISDVKSAIQGKSSWGVLLGIGWGSTGMAVNPVVRNNVIFNITGKSARGIGLEGNSPGAFVTNNSIDNIISTNPSSDACGVTVMTNTGAASVSINNNSFTNVTYGIVNVMPATINGTCNWYGSAIPATVSAMILGNVNYTPWLIGGTDASSAIGFLPGDPCTGGPVSMSVTVTVTNVSCNGGSDGTATANVTGGVAPFTYLWNTVPPQTTQTATGLTAGTYAVTVTDAASSTASASGTVTEPAPFEFTVEITESGPDAFCNTTTLTAEPSITGNYTYSWKGPGTFTATGQTLALGYGDANGIYTVTVTSTGVCHEFATTSYDYEKENLVNSYTILGLKKVELGENNYVFSGSVGATDTKDGEVKVGKNCTINAPGSFVKAKKITVDPSSLVPVKIYSPVTVTLPAMQYGGTATGSNLNVPNNTTMSYSGNYKDIKIGSNCNVTFTNGTLFGNLEVGKNSTVTFSAVPALSFGNIKMDEGDKLIFGGNVSVRCNKDVTIKKSSMVNPNYYNVVFYLDDKGKFGVEGGGNTNINASVYTPEGNIEVSGYKDKNTYMTGFYIANEIKSKDKNIFWNSYDCSTSHSLVFSGSYGDDRSTGEFFAMENNKMVTAYPNPSVSGFNLKINTGSSEEVRVRVYDMLGRLVKEMNAQPDQIFTFGEDFDFGIYIAEVKQGDQKEVVRLIRQ
ncbi:MAG: T9SS type A sorting domain-containing protein [Bacteroidetes bacterium]|nr:T9SS type A sorting domain-containing protein [Bacteroidota bacterium]